MKSENIEPSNNRVNGQLNQLLDKWSGGLSDAVITYIKTEKESLSRTTVITFFIFVSTILTLAFIKAEPSYSVMVGMAYLFSLMLLHNQRKK